MNLRVPLPITSNLLANSTTAFSNNNESSICIYFFIPKKFLVNIMTQLISSLDSC